MQQPQTVVHSSFFSRFVESVTVKLKTNWLLRSLLQRCLIPLVDAKEYGHGWSSGHCIAVGKAWILQEAQT